MSVQAASPEIVAAPSARPRPVPSGPTSPKYPLRLRTSTKLGYKNAKWIKAIEVSNEFRETYWSERGFNWYAGI